MISTKLGIFQGLSTKKEAYFIHVFVGFVDYYILIEMCLLLLLMPQSTSVNRC